MAHSVNMDRSFIKLNSKSYSIVSESSVTVDPTVINKDVETQQSPAKDNQNFTSKIHTENTNQIHKKHKDTTEGQQGIEDRDTNCSYSCGLDLIQCGSLGLNLTTSSSCIKKTNMERVSDHSPYSSDEWEDSDHSDTDGDHSDSSDDDDPKSQVDRLIERGTLMFMDDETSALSSESDSDDSYYNYNDDSESDITDVSPLISAAASPIGLSPVLPRRTLTTSPLALNHPLTCENEGEVSHKCWSQQNNENRPHHTDSTDMSLLVQAVMELEKKKSRRKTRHRAHHLAHIPNSSPGVHNNIHPIHDSPHHRHLTRSRCCSSNRKNMSFSNDEVRRIDRDNKILLNKIMAAHNRTKSHSSPHLSINNYHHHHSHYRSVHHKPANATINRKKDVDKIRRENLILLRKIQEAKPSREVTDSRSPRHSHRSYIRSPHSLSSGSCSLSARANHVTAPPPRKETAL